MSEDMNMSQKTVTLLLILALVEFIGVLILALIDMFTPIHFLNVAIKFVSITVVIEMIIVTIVYVIDMSKW